MIVSGHRRFSLYQMPASEVRLLELAESAGWIVLYKTMWDITGMEWTGTKGDRQELGSANVIKKGTIPERSKGQRLANYNHTGSPSTATSLLHACTLPNLAGSCAGGGVPGAMAGTII